MTTELSAAPAPVRPLTRDQIMRRLTLCARLPSLSTINSALRDLGLPVDHGALVQQVTPGGPADKAGIKAGEISAQLNGSAIQLGGDIITKVNGHQIRSDTDLANAIANKKKGDKVELTVVRGKTTKTVTVTLADRPASLDNTVTQTP